MRNIFCKKHKFIVYVVFSLLSALFAKVFTYMPFGHYEQNDYCVVQGLERDLQWFKQNNSDFFELSRKKGKVFVEIDGQFIGYDPVLHQSQTNIFIELDGHDIKTSNSKSFALGDPCTLTQKFYIIYLLLSLAFFLFLNVVFSLDKNSKSNQKNDKLRKVAVLILILFISSRIADFAIYPALSHNPQQEYCKSQAESYNRWQRAMYPDFFNKEIKKAFVEINDKFVSYDPLLHSDYEIVFVECDGCDIHLSNSKSVSGENPCTLTKDFYGFYVFLFVTFFLLLRFVIYPLLIKPKKPTNAGE